MKKSILMCLYVMVLFFNPVATQAQNLQGNFSNVPQSKTQMQLSFAPLVKKTAPAVVNIYTKRVVQQQVRHINPFFNDPFFENFFGQSFGHGLNRRGMTRERVENMLGSGVIVDKSGLIISNAHVIKGGTEIVVVLADGREFQAEQVFLDETVDLAVLKIDAKGEVLPVLKPQGDKGLEVGDLVLAIGNPFGVGQTVTSGIVSATARSPEGISDFSFFIQTDAAINPGNSGGALVNMNGDLVGVNTAIFSRSGGSLGIGFAIPSSMVKSVLTSVKAGAKTLQKPWIGANGQEIVPDIAETMGLSGINGALLTRVDKGGPADKAGLRQGDVIVSLNGEPVSTPNELRFELALVPIGSPMMLKVWRKGKYLTKTITAILPPETVPRQETLMQGRGNPLLGAVVANLSPAVAEELSMPADETGVVVVRIERATRIGLREGDIIQEINGVEIKSIDQLTEMLKTQANRWQMSIKRDKQIINVMVSG